MRLIKTGEVTKLTGLSTEQLREWTSRRALIPADVQRRGHGTAAQYSWQTVLLIRIAVQLRDRFRIELKAHSDLLRSMRTRLASMSVAELWGQRVAIYGVTEWSLFSELEKSQRDAIVISLDPHLAAISASFALLDAGREQLDLFQVAKVIGSDACGLNSTLRGAAA